MLERDNYTCVYCRKQVKQYNKSNFKITPNDLATVDHIIPRSKGGKFIVDNLATCCVECNNLLGDKFCTVEEKINFISTYGARNIYYNKKYIKWEREQKKQLRKRILR